MLKVGAYVHPGFSSAVTTITGQVDPICAQILAGFAPQPGVTAQWISQETVQLEDAR